MADKNSTKKRKTSVSLPGSLKSLVRDVQSGETQQVAQSDKAAATAQPESQPEKGGVGEGSAPAPQTADAPAAQQGDGSAAQQGDGSAAKQGDGSAAKQEGDASTARQDDDAPTARKAGGAAQEPAARTVTRESTADSWGLFLDLAREYKEKDSHLSTIYIDRDLKNVLDRLRASRDVRMPTTAILSAIVARFIFDHEQRIKDAIYGDRLI